MDELVQELASLLESVRLGLEAAGEGYVVTYDKERHPVAALPLSGLDLEARRAELLAVAAGFDAAIKSPAEPTPGETFRAGAPSLFPKLERRRFVDAYNAVVTGRGGGQGEMLLFTEFGADLVTCYVQDEGWRVLYVNEAVRQGWDVSLGTVDSAARSHLYARADLYDDDTVVNVGDYFDAARVTILGDRYFHRAERDGIVCAVPDRDQLFIGPETAQAPAIRERYEASSYPLCPYVLRFDRGAVRRVEDGQTAA